MNIANCFAQAVKVRSAMAIQSFFVIVFLASNSWGASFPPQYDTQDANDDGLRSIEGLPAYSEDLVALGDVNGDGFADMGGWVSERTDGDEIVGDIVLLYGSADKSPVYFDLENLANSNAVRIENVRSISPAGDLNGDALADWIYHSAKFGDGVVFGKSGTYPPTLRIDQLGVGEVMRFNDALGPIDGVTWSREYRAGGDINGDGIDDLLIQELSSSAYRVNVLVGNSAGYNEAISVNDIPAQWMSSIRFSLPTNTGTCFCWREFRVSGGGDFNNDGYDDIVVSLSQTTFPGVQIFVIFGNPQGLIAQTDKVSLNGLTGFSIIDGAGRGANLSPDVNGDGIDDLLLSLEAIHVLYGSADMQTSEIDIDSQSSANGYYVPDAPRIPIPVPAGDVNNDGIEDWLTYRNYYGATTEKVHVVYGTTAERGHFKLALLDGTDGFTLTGGAQTAAPVGDVDGDGIDDLLIGADTSTIVYGRAVGDELGVARKVRAVLAQGYIGIRWLPSLSERVVGYDIYRDNALIASVEANATFFRDTDYQSGVEYVYEVKARDYIDRISDAAGITVVHDFDQFPAAPVAEIYSDSLAELFFYTEYPAFTYFYRNDVPVAQSYAQSYLDADYTTQGQTYFLEVETYSRTLGRVILLRSASVALPDDVMLDRPSMPGGLRYEVYSSSMLELFWNEPQRIVEPALYEISRDGEVLATTNGTSFVDVSFSNSWRLNYEVVAVDVNGGRSEPARFEIYISNELRKLQVANAVSLSAAVYSDSVVEVFWQPADVGLRPVGYEILRDNEVIGTTDGTSYLDTGLDTNTLYSYRILPYAADGTRPTTWQPSISAITGGYPQPITGFKILAYGPGVVELFWDRPGYTVTRVRILRDGEEIAVSGNSSYVDIDATPGSTHEYTLVAVSRAGLETPNVPIAISTPAQVD